MKKKTLSQAVEDFRGLIVYVRGVPVILDSDLARVYGVTTGALNQAVKRNIGRFPDEFLFTVKPQDVTRLISQIVISNDPAQPLYSSGLAVRGRGGRRKAVYAFTEHGAIMASMILNTPQAVQMSVFVVKAFVAMRSMLTGQRDLAKKLAELERTLNGIGGMIVEVTRRSLFRLCARCVLCAKPTMRGNHESGQSSHRN